ncbi:MAG: TPM domain-containing protein [Candidatus Acidiferrales bacterium]
MKRAVEIFTPAEREKINQAVAEAEKRTAGEIVPVLATASGRYDRAEDIGGLLLGLTLLASLWTAFQRILPVEGDWTHGQQLQLDLPWLVLMVIGGFVVGTAIVSRVGWLRRLFVSQREMRQEVERAAWQSFARFRVGRTAAGTGILLYVSLFERMVCVLGDDPIAAKIDQKTWDEIRDLILRGIGEKRVADGFCQAIARSGELLAQHFPCHPGDVNELSNELRVLN